MFRGIFLTALFWGVVAHGQTVPVKAAESPKEASKPTPGAAVLGVPWKHATPLGKGLTKVWETHPDVQQALAEIRAADNDISGARAGYYPNAQLQTVQANRNVRGGGVGNGTIARFNIPLYSGGSTGAEIDSARARKNQAEAGLSLSRLNLGLRYGDAYFNALAAQNQVDLLEKNLLSLRKLSQTITRRAEEGAAPDADVKTAITRLRLAESQLAQARAAEITQRLTLKALQGDEAGYLSWPAQARLSGDEMSAVFDHALGTNPTVVRADADIALQEAQSRLARSRLAPDVSLQYSKGIGAVSPFTYPEQTQIIANFQTDNAIKGFEAFRGALQRLDGVRSRRETVIRDLDQSLSGARAQSESLVLQLRSQRLAVESAVQLVDSYLRQYVVGRKTWIEVLNAQREATDTQIQFVTLNQNYWQTTTRLALTAMYWDEWADRTADAGVRDIMEIKP